jgi:hypothetical protein
VISNYVPDRWLLLYIKSESDSVTKILSGWTGGYLGADEWRLSSGVIKIIDAGDHYEMHNESGSVYTCVKHREGTTGYTAGILNRWLSMSDDSGTTISTITVDDYQIKNPKE